MECPEGEEYDPITENCIKRCRADETRRNDGETKTGCRKTKKLKSSKKTSKVASPNKSSPSQMSSDELQSVNVDAMVSVPTEYPAEFIEFCVANELKPPKTTTGNGKALAAMLHNTNKFWTRETCDQFVKKFDIKTSDSIQLFNKHSQWGILTNSGTSRGKIFIVYPYRLSNKHKMRKDFKFDGTDEEKSEEVERIKSTIKHDYIDVPNSAWQLGHKNPASIDSSTNNLIMQPPIQGKYRDNYIFWTAIDKFPVPHKLKSMIDKKEIIFTAEQAMAYKDLFEQLLATL